MVCSHRLFRRRSGTDKEIAQYSNLSLDMEREIFQRVQMGVVLRESGLSPVTLAVIIAWT